MRGADFNVLSCLMPFFFFCFPAPAMHFFRVHNINKRENEENTYRRARLINREKKSSFFFSLSPSLFFFFREGHAHTHTHNEKKKKKMRPQQHFVSPKKYCLKLTSFYCFRSNAAQRDVPYVIFYVSCQSSLTVPPDFPPPFLPPSLKLCISEPTENGCIHAAFFSSYNKVRK